MAFSKDDIRNLAGGSVTGSDGTKIGEISQFYLSDSTGEPTWATVKTGLFGSQESFVPLSGATVEGNELHVAYDKAAVREAPRVDTDGHLTLEEEANLLPPLRDLRRVGSRARRRLDGPRWAAGSG